MVSTITRSHGEEQRPPPVPYILIFQETDTSKASAFFVDMFAAQRRGGGQGQKFVEDIGSVLQLMRHARTTQLYVPSDTENESHNAAAWGILESYGFTSEYHFCVPRGTEGYVRSVENNDDILIVPGPCAVIYLNLCA